MSNRVFLVLAFYLLFGHSTCLAQASDEQTPFYGFMKSMEWCESLQSYEVEMVRKVSAQDSLPNGRDGFYGERVHMLREWRDHTKGTFFISHADGNTSITLKPGADRNSDRLRVSVASGDVERAQIVDLGEMDGVVFRRRENIKSCLERARRFELDASLFDVWLNMDDNMRATELERFAQLLIHLKPADVYVTNETYEGRKNTTVYRFCKKMAGQSKGPVFAYKLVVSNDGIDQGLAIGFQQGMLREEQKGMRYVEESQIAENHQLHSSQIRWKKWPDRREEGSENEGRVLPDLVTKKQTTRLNRADGGGTLESVTTETISFDWRSFEPPKPEKMNTKACEVVCRELQKQVEKTLNRLPAGR